MIVVRDNPGRGAVDLSRAARSRPGDPVTSQQMDEFRSDRATPNCLKAVPDLREYAEWIASLPRGLSSARGEGEAR